MTRFFCAFAALWLSFSMAQSADLVIEGQIIDGRDRPVGGARIFTMPPTNLTCTDTLGRYRIVVDGARTTNLVEVVAIKNGLPVGSTVISVGLRVTRRQADMVMTEGTPIKASIHCRRSRLKGTLNVASVSGRIVNS